MNAIDEKAFDRWEIEKSEYGASRDKLRRQAWEGACEYKQIEIDSLASGNASLANERDELMSLTRMLDEHPEDYNGPCECLLCRSYMENDGE